MDLLTLFTLAVGLSMDAFAVSICKGLAMRRITLGKAAVVGLWFGGFQAGMPFLGYLLGVQFRIGSRPSTTGSPSCSWASSVST